MFFLRLCVRACVDVFARRRGSVQVTVVAVEHMRVCYTVFYLCMCVAWCSLIPVDAVISEDVAVYVSTLWDENMFLQQQFAIHFIIIDHQVIGRTKALYQQWWYQLITFTVLCSIR